MCSRPCAYAGRSLMRASAHRMASARLFAMSAVISVSMMRQADLCAASVHTEDMANQAAHTTRKSPRYIRAITPTAMSIATTAIVITSIRLYSPPSFVLESAPCQAHTRDLDLFWRG